MRLRMFLSKRHHLRGRPMAVRSPGPLGSPEQEDLFRDQCHNRGYRRVTALAVGKETPRILLMAAISLSFTRKDDGVLRVVDAQPKT
jgi:hypothetical protein